MRFLLAFLVLCLMVTDTFACHLFSGIRARISARQEARQMRRNPQVESYSATTVVSTVQSQVVVPPPKLMPPVPEKPVVVPAK